MTHLPIPALPARTVQAVERIRVRLLSAGPAYRRMLACRLARVVTR